MLQCRSLRQADIVYPLVTPMLSYEQSTTFAQYTFRLCTKCSWCCDSVPIKLKCKQCGFRETNPAQSSKQIYVKSHHVRKEGNLNMCI